MEGKIDVCNQPKKMLQVIQTYHAVSVATEARHQRKRRVRGPTNDRGIDSIDGSLEDFVLLEDSVLDCTGDHDLSVRDHVAHISKRCIRGEPLVRQCADELQHGAACIVLDLIVDNQSRDCAQNDARARRRGARGRNRSLVVS